ncbi:MAG: hypothetical protein U0U70_04530 [Chitinophagaceae bacterium]
MKKIFTLFVGLLLTAAVFAADRRPTLTVTSQKNYKIVIDGRTYFSSNMTIRLSDLYGNRYDNRHSIQVFEMRKGFFTNRERMVASTSFYVNNKDLFINIDWFGRISIKEMRGPGRFDRDDRDDHDWNRDNDRRDRDHNDGPGRRF